MVAIAKRILTNLLGARSYLKEFVNVTQNTKILTASFAKMKYNGAFVKVRNLLLCFCGGWRGDWGTCGIRVAIVSTSQVT